MAKPKDNEEPITETEPAETEPAEADGTETAQGDGVEVVEPGDAQPVYVLDRSKTTLEKGTGESGEDEVQQRVDVENAAGYVGSKTDPIPNENYTVEGVTKTDDALVSAESTEVNTVEENAKLNDGDKS